MKAGTTLKESIMFLLRCRLVQSEAINFVNDFEDIKEKSTNFGERQMLFLESWDIRTLVGQGIKN